MTKPEARDEPSNKTVARLQQIFHSPKTAGHFTQIDNAPLNNPKLSPKAKGVLAYLLSKPSSWKIRIPDICKHSGCGEYVVKAALQELADAGHAKLIKARDAKGRLIGSHWVIYEAPIGSQPEGNLSANVRECGLPVPGFIRSRETKPLSNTKVLSNTKKDSNTDREAFALKNKERRQVVEQSNLSAQEETKKPKIASGTETGKANPQAPSGQGRPNWQAIQRYSQISGYGSALLDGFLRLNDMKGWNRVPDWKTAFDEYAAKAGVTKRHFEFQNKKLNK